MRRVAGIIAAGAALLLGLLTITLFAAAPAQAHAQLIGTAPGDQQTVTSAPEYVVLEFSGDVISLGLQFQVIGPSGLASRGKAVVNRRIVTQTLASPLADGAYVVNWHVVHDDGHPDSGSFRFVIDAPAGAVAATPAASGPAAASTAVAFQPVAASPEGIPPFWVSVGLLLVLVVVVVAVMIDRGRRRRARSEQ